MYQLANGVTERSCHSSGSHQKKASFLLFTDGTFDDVVDDRPMIVSGIELRPKTTGHPDEEAETRRSFITAVVNGKEQLVESSRSNITLACKGDNNPRVKVTKSSNDDGSDQIRGQVTISELESGIWRELVKEELGVPRPIQIYLEDDNTGEAYRASMETTATINDVVIEIYEKSGIEPDELTYNGRYMAFGNSLKSYEIGEGSVIHFTHRRQCCSIL